MFIFPLSNESSQSLKESLQALHHKIDLRKCFCFKLSQLESAYTVSIYNGAGTQKQKNILQSCLVSLTLHSCEGDVPILLQRREMEMEAHGPAEGSPWIGGHGMVWGSCHLPECTSPITSCSHAVSAYYVFCFIFENTLENKYMILRFWALQHRI